MVAAATLPPTSPTTTTSRSDPLSPLSPLRIVGSVSEPGRPDRANEDGYGVAGAFAFVIDGATGLGDSLIPSAQSDAAWLTAAMGAAFARLAPSADGPSELLAGAAAETARRFEAERARAPKERFEIPTAAVLVAMFGADAVEIAELGDCGIFIKTGGQLTRFGGSARGKALEQENAGRLMAGGAGKTPEVIAFLREIRNKANTPDGYAIFAPEEGCSAGARLVRHPLSPPSAATGAAQALLVTDGYEAAIDDYRLYDAETLFRTAREDVTAPLRALRAVEASDPDCTRFPRFKPSDDATALMIEIERKAAR